MQQRKIVLITGAASGIGLQTAKQFIANGAHVIAADLNKKALEENAQALGENYRTVVVDVTKESDIIAAQEQVQKEYGHLDSLVNGAGHLGMGEIDTITPADFDREFAINVRGPMLMVKHFADLLRQGTNGSVVNISSIAAIVESPGGYVYSAGKAALLKFTKDCAAQIPGVRHNAVLPGVINTPLLNDMPGGSSSAVLEAATKVSPMGRHGKPEDIANAIEFLCSDKASYISGASLVVDGGIVPAGSSPF